MLDYRYGFYEEQFHLTGISYIPGVDWMCLNCFCVNLVDSLQHSQVRKLTIFQAILVESGFLQWGETRADMTCERKEPAEADKLIVDVFGVIGM